MGYFRLLKKLYPKSPDPILQKSKYAEAALARMAHVNSIIGDLNDIGHYELDLNSSFTLPITTSKGIIDIENLGGVVPGWGFGQPIIITLTNNPVLNIANRDKLYLQTTPYYSPTVDDQFIPYVVATGFLDGLNLTIWNASSSGSAPNDGQGAFYIYYEIKYIG